MRKCVPRNDGNCQLALALFLLLVNSALVCFWVEGREKHLNSKFEKVLLVSKKKKSLKPPGFDIAALVIAKS